MHAYRKTIGVFSAMLVGLVATSVRADGVPGSGISDFYYNVETGAMFLDSDGATLVSKLIEGPQAQSIDRFSGADAETGSTWIQNYFQGKEQWIDVSLTGIQGVFKIATYEAGLSEADFPSVEYGTLDGNTLFTQVTSLLYASDFNRDGVVNSDDLIAWQADFGVTGNSDANNDGISDGHDFLIWQRQFGSGAELATAIHVIPEPSGIALLLLSCMIAIAGHRRVR